MGLIEWIKWLFGKRNEEKSEVLINTDAVKDTVAELYVEPEAAESTIAESEVTESLVQDSADDEGKADFNSLMEDYFILRERVSDVVKSAKKMQKQGEYKDVFEMLSDVLENLAELSSCLEKSISAVDENKSDVKSKLNELLSQITDSHTSLVEFESESPNIGDAKTIVSILDTLVTDLDTAESTELQELLAVN